MVAASRSAPERLNRFLARRGVASRRGADLLITAGRVVVNGRGAALGTTVDPEHDEVRVDGRRVGDAPHLRTVLLNKPVGVVSTRHDPQGRPTVLDLVDDPEALYPVGRLDADTRGLLLLTSDGDLAFRLTHPRYRVRKIYHATVAAPATARALREMTAGVQLEDGWARAVEASVERSAGSEDMVAVVMEEGRKREVRRLCAAVGLRVRDLCRVGLGPLRLGRLREGTARPLTAREEAALYAAVGLPAPSVHP